MTFVKPNKTDISKKSDLVETKEIFAKIIIKHFKPAGICLDPSSGLNNVFYNNLPEPKYRCEILDGLDYFDFNKKVDWIITNPPYSLYDKFLLKSFEISENIVFLVPLTKAFKSIKIDKAIEKYGGLKEVLHMGTGSTIGFPFGFPVGCLYYKKNYKGPIEFNRIYEFF